MCLEYHYVSMIFRLDFGTVLTVWYFLFSILLTLSIQSVTPGR
jgi:hypothetical protein